MAPEWCSLIIESQYSNLVGCAYAMEQSLRPSEGDYSHRIKMSRKDWDPKNWWGQFYPKKIIQIDKVELSTEISVVYFDQHLACAAPKHWLKYTTKQSHSKVIQKSYLKTFLSKFNLTYLTWIYKDKTRPTPKNEEGISSPAHEPCLNMTIHIPLLICH